MSELLAIGVSHKTAPVEVRERVALPEARAATFLRDLRGTGEVQEAVAISTCNRTELYVVVGDPVEAESRALAMLANRRIQALIELVKSKFPGAVVESRKVPSRPGEMPIALIPATGWLNRNCNGPLPSALVLRIRTPLLTV